MVSAVFALKRETPEEIWAKMKELIARRTASQPLDVPSAGSAFKRPTGGYAAALIEEAGLKGYQVGGAAISAKHAGFAVNLGGATAADVKRSAVPGVRAGLSEKRHPVGAGGSHLVTYR